MFAMALNVTLTSLEALVLKATHESLSSPETAALEAFCAVMRDSNDGPQYATQALASRIHSSNSQEVLLALTMIDRCMRKGDSNFQAEIGKFRFLNEMIKLVSPKYLADRTTAEVKTRVIQLLHAWAIEYPKENKFKVAYDMLKNQGVVKETPPPLPSETSPTTKQRPKNAIFDDEEKSKLLQKLLQSKRPEDLQHANRLIKTMVREEERRNEANSRRAQEVNAALDSAGLLRDMLDNAGDASADEEQLIHELHATCARLRPTLQHLAAADNKNYTLDDILHVSDVLDEVSQKYAQFIHDKKQNTKSTSVNSNGDALLDLASTTTHGVGDSRRECRVIDELGDIFTANGAASVETLKPVSLGANTEPNLLGESSKKKDEGWDVLNTLGEQMLKQSLPDTAKRMDTFVSKQTIKIPMNALEKASPSQDTSKTNEAMLDLDFFTRKPEQNTSEPSETPSPKSSPTDVMMVDISDNQASISNTDSHLEKILDLQISEEKCDKVGSKSNVSNETELTSLDDINVSLENVQPGLTPPKIALDKEGLIVNLHFCKDRPKPGVSVIVVSTISKKNMPIDDFVFHATVPKGCKVRMLPPSGSSLPPHNPFIPPPALTQIILVNRPNTDSMRLNYVIIYTCDDRTSTEMGEIHDLPLE